ncbi:hypothetical protein MKW92_042399 [Papaver armeniacum]|nr:hypothetical protein MKW92_042399 [Papaver armeniacum]
MEGCVSVIICGMWLQREGTRSWSINCILSRTSSGCFGYDLLISSKERNLAAPSTLVEFDVKLQEPAKN